VGRRMRGFGTACAVTAGLALALTGCGSSSGSADKAASPGAVKVVAAENIWGDIAKQIGGEHIAVTSLISDPSADPHTFESGPKVASAIGSADVVIVNGGGYDDFASKLLSANPRSGRAVVTVADVVVMTSGSANPHLWYSSTYVTAAARAITSELTAKDSADASAYAAGLARFLDSYAPYAGVVAQIKSRYAGTKVAYTERVPGYLIAAAGLEIGAPQGFAQAVEDGNDPSLGDTAEFAKALRDHAIKVLLYNDQVTDSQTDEIKSAATSAGVPIVGVAETIPKGAASFQQWQIDQAKALLAALGG
jgi:zinc/manganese transport system substrate-binding protein